MGKAMREDWTETVRQGTRQGEELVRRLRRREPGRKRCMDGDCERRNQARREDWMETDMEGTRQGERLLRGLREKETGSREAWKKTGKEGTRQGERVQAKRMSVRHEKKEAVNGEADSVT